MAKGKFKRKETRKRFALQNEEFAPLKEVVIETSVDFQSIGASLFLPGYDRIHRIDFWIGSAGYFFDPDEESGTKDPVEAVRKDLESALHDLDQLEIAIATLRDFLSDQEDALYERVMAKAEELLKKRREKRPEVADVEG